MRDAEWAMESGPSDTTSWLRREWMVMKMNRLILICLCLAVIVCAPANAQSKRADMVSAPAIYARIIQLEDERNLNGDELIGLLKHRSAAVRERAALAIGRIGDKRGANALIAAMREDKDHSVRVMAAFALGEIEDAQAIHPLLDVLNSSKESLVVLARAAEALGKIASIQANNEKLGQATLDTISQSLIKQLSVADAALSADRKLLTSLTITALMRLRNPASVEPLTRQLKSKDAEIRAQAANALARLRQPINSATPALIEALNDSDANVRANAVRALGVSKDARAVEPLIKSLDDRSEQAQANTIRALAAINDKRAVEPIIKLGERLLAQHKARLEETDREKFVRPPTINLLLEIATAIGTLRDRRGLDLLNDIRPSLGEHHPEVEIALGRIEDDNYSMRMRHEAGLFYWRGMVAIAQGLAANQTEHARLTTAPLLEMVDKNAGVGNTPESKMFDARSIPELLRAVVKLKVEGAEGIVRRKLAHQDVIVRATAATLLEDFQNDQNLSALVSAFALAKTDGANDAKLATLTAISKYKSPQAIAAVKSALADQDHLVRRHAVDLLKQMGAGDFSDRIGIVQTGHDKLFYQRVAARLNKKITATIHTDKGQIKLELFPQDAPITVDSFIALARKGYFNNLTFHRVVPNFVIQGGDPRGDGEGGPGYQIRCEINTRPYTRGAVGMALSGKDTGGSQFFITHSPQPHLDGGYTVFGHVTSGMEVVERIARGDLIKRVEIVESSNRP